MMRSVANWFNGLNCKMGLHEWRALKGEQAKTLFKMAEEKGLDPVESWTMATPIYCLHCRQIEPGYQEIIDLITKIHNQKEQDREGKIKDTTD